MDEMSDNKYNPEESGSLRKQAEKIYKKNRVAFIEERSKSKVEKLKLVHELQVHQIELEMQNEELQRTRLELEIAKNEEFRIIFDSVADGIIVADIVTKKFYRANNAICKMLGYSSSELNKLSVSDLHYEKDLPYVMSQFERQSKGDLRLAKDMPVKRKDGTVFYADVNATHMTIEGKKYIVGIFHDMTEHKRMENEQKRLVTIIEASPGFVGFADAKDKHIRYINKAGRMMCGIGSDEDVAKFKIDDCHPEWAAKKLSEEIFPAVVINKTWVGECAFKNIRNNHEIPVLMVVIPLENPNGEIEILATISQDITQLKKEQEERLDLEKQLFQSQKIESIGALTCEITHDMNNIFSAISGYTSLFLAEHSEKDAKRNYIQNIEKLGEKGTEIVNQIRIFSKLNKIIIEPIDIKGVIEETLRLLQIRLKHIADVSIAVIPNQRLPIMGDATQIGQMLLNLFSNSCDAMEGKWGKLDIIIDEVSFIQNTLPLPDLKPGRYLKLTVSDTGKGMSAEVKKQIFNAFYTTKGDKGTGLGLNIVKRVISSHNGAISVDSTPGLGTTFYIYFPVINNMSVS